MNIACSICLESFTLTCNIYTTPCGHVFHYECILKWLESGNRHCSQCRKSCMTNQIFKLFFSANNLALQENNTTAQIIDQLKIDNLKLEQEVNKLKARELREIQKCAFLKKENINLSTKCVDLKKENINLSENYHQSWSHCGGMERVLKKQREDLNDKDKKIEEFQKAINNACNNVQFDEKNVLSNFPPLPMAFSNSDEQLRLQDQLHDAVVKSNVEDYKVILTQIGEHIGDTALHNAAQFGDAKTFKLILDLHSAEDKNPKNIIGKTPLHLAAEWGHVEICQIILQVILNHPVTSRFCYGKNPKDYGGSTPLHYAAKWGHTKICEMILAEVSNKNPMNELGETVLSVARQAGNNAICRLIESALVKNPLKLKRRPSSFNEYQTFVHTRQQRRARNKRNITEKVQDLSNPESFI